MSTNPRNPLHRRVADYRAVTGDRHNSRGFGTPADWLKANAVKMRRVNVTRIARETRRTLAHLEEIFFGETFDHAYARAETKRLNRLTRLRVSERIAGTAESSRLTLSSVVKSVYDGRGQPPETDRLKNSNGAVTIHFQVTSVSRGGGGRKGKGESELHQNYIERDGAPDIVAALRIDGGSPADGYEAYLARAESVERNDMIAATARAHKDFDEAPRETESGFAYVGNIGRTRKERESFWREVDAIEPTAKSGSIFIAKVKECRDAISSALAQDTRDKNRKLKLVEDEDGFARIVVPDGESGADLANLINANASSKLQKAVRPASYTPGRSGRTQTRLIIELPHELSPLARYNALQQFCEAEFGSRKLRYFGVIHKPDPGGDQRNFHAHIVMYDRPAKRLWRHLRKDRPETDDDLKWDFAVVGRGYRGREIRPYAASKNRDIAAMSWVKSSRRNWVAIINEELEKAGSSKRHFSESYMDAGINVIPGAHLGPAATALERRGEISATGDENEQRMAKRRPRSKRYLADWTIILDDINEIGAEPSVVIDLVEGIHDPRFPVDPITQMAAEYVQHAAWVANYMELRRQEQRRMRDESGRLAYLKRRHAERSAVSWGDANAKRMAKGLPAPKSESDARARRDRALAREADELAALEVELTGRHKRIWSSLVAAEAERDVHASRANALRELAGIGSYPLRAVVDDPIVRVLTAHARETRRIAQLPTAKRQTPVPQPDPTPSELQRVVDQMIDNETKYWETPKSYREYLATELINKTSNKPEVQSEIVRAFAIQFGCERREQAQIARVDESEFLKSIAESVQPDHTITNLICSQEENKRARYSQLQQTAKSIPQKPAILPQTIAPTRATATDIATAPTSAATAPVATAMAMSPESRSPAMPAPVDEVALFSPSKRRESARDRLRRAADDGEVIQRGQT